MTEPEMNVKLCEALGWRFQSADPFDNECVYPPSGAAIAFKNLPNHFSPTAEGLWACHQAEKGLNLSDEVSSMKGNGWVVYVKNLCEVVGCRKGWPDDPYRACAFATAPQRALALYRTICQ